MSTVATIEEQSAEVRVRRASGTAFRNWKVRIGLALVAALLVVAAIGPLVSPYNFAELSTGAPFEPPSALHWLGTDLHGRDLLSRLLQGTRTALALPVAVAGITLLIALPLGLLVGYLGGTLDDATMSVVDILLSLPWILIALVVVSYRGPGLASVVLALPIVFAAPIVRITRNSVRRVVRLDYVIAARAIGESQVSILVRYVLRNTYFPVLVLVTSQLGYAILAESAMSYLGLGVQSPHTSWGLELATGADFAASAPHLVIFPGIMIAWAVMGFSFLGDGLGDVLDAQHDED
jgi:peptide/nickel transport system permease protein